MRAAGPGARRGTKTYVFDPADSFGVLDWGRGVWTYHNTWYWGSASGQVEGVPFGWNIGYGFGDTSAASENMLFYGGKAHKLSQVRFHIPHAGGAGGLSLSPWTLYLRRRAVRDGLRADSGPGRLHGREAHQIRPAPGVRPLHGNGHSGRRNQVIRVRDMTRVCGKSGEQVVKNSARSGTEWALWLLWIICPWRKSGRCPHRPGRCSPGRLWPPGPRTR